MTWRNRFLGKYGVGVLLAATFLIGMAAAILKFAYAAAFLVIVPLVAGFAYLRFRRPDSRDDIAEWQRQVDREYRLDIDGNRIALFRNGVLTTQFVWSEVIEIQSIHRHDHFPPLWWKIITNSGEYLLPMGGHRLAEFERRFVHALSGYYEQRTVTIDQHNGVNSLWRQNDPYPKRPAGDDFC